MLLNKHKSNRLPFIALCLLTVGFFWVWALTLRNGPEDPWGWWRGGLIAGGLYLLRIYSVADSDFPVIRIIWLMAIFWCLTMTPLTIYSFITWQLPSLHAAHVPDLLVAHIVISILSVFCVRLFPDL